MWNPLRIFTRNNEIISVEQQIENLKKEINSLVAQLDETPTFRKRATSFLKFTISLPVSTGIGYGAFYAAELFLVMLLPPAVPTLAVGGLAFVGAELAMILANNKLHAKNKQKILVKIKTLTSDLLNLVLGKLGEGSLTEFVLNPEFILANPFIETFKITEDLRKKLGYIFRDLNNKEYQTTLETIDISHAEMNEKHFKALLSAGMDKFNTKKLVLANNKLTDDAIVALSMKVAKADSTSFRSLKILDLSGNELTGMSLTHIANIVQHLKIEEINLSNNPNLCKGAFNELTDFFMTQPTEMPSLKRVTMQNVGLTSSHVGGLNKMISSLTLLEFLDLTRNNLQSYDVDVLLSKAGLKHNISIKEIKTDHNDECAEKLKKIFNKHDNALKACDYDSATNMEHRVIYLLNLFSKNKKLPEGGIQEIIDTNHMSEVVNGITTQATFNKPAIEANDFIVFMNTWLATRRIRSAVANPVNSMPQQVRTPGFLSSRNK